MDDLISRQAAIDALDSFILDETTNLQGDSVREILESLPSAQPEQRYTEEELMIFRHGISLRLLSKRSAQHWNYSEKTAKEIEFLERLYKKVGADMRGEQYDTD